MSQRDVVLRLLHEAGPAGVSAHDLVYRHGITRGAAVVFDLREEGFDIDTIEEGTLPDGRRRLARYILQERAQRPAPRPPATAEAPLPPPKEVRFPCGCVRAASGKEWASRCPKHSGQLIATKGGEVVPW